MEIINEWPLNIDNIRKKFDLSKFNPVFTYGDKLYNPTGLPIPQDLMVHEEVHSKQQSIGVEQWWAMYLELPKFRLDQEVEAYQAQYQFLTGVLNRKARRHALQILAQNLSSELYGKLVTKKEAENLICQKNK